MKTYHFTALFWSIVIFCIWASILIYGMIWLNNGYKVDDKLQIVWDEMRKQDKILGDVISNRTKEVEENQRVKIFMLQTDKLSRGDIMPSALRGRR